MSRVRGRQLDLHFSCVDITEFEICAFRWLGLLRSAMVALQRIDDPILAGVARGNLGASPQSGCPLDHIVSKESPIIARHNIPPNCLHPSSR